MNYFVLFSFDFCKRSNYQERIKAKESQLWDILHSGNFNLYVETFEQFGFGTITQSLLLLPCCPIERFLVNDKPYFRGDHDISLRKFQAYLGVGYSSEISGDTSAKQDKIKKSWKGSDLVRSHLFAHGLVTVGPNKQSETEVIAKLKASWLNSRIHTYYGLDAKTGQRIQKQRELPSFKALGKDGLCRLLFYETKLLYQLLLNQLI